MKILAAFFIDDKEDLKDNVGFNYVIAALRQEGHNVESIHDRFMNFDLQKIIELKPQVALFSLYDWYLARTLQIIRKIKENFPDTTIIVGGPAVHFTAERLIENYQYIDYAVYGEGEETIVSLLRNDVNLKDIPNLVYREAGKIIKTDKKYIEDLDSLPIPLSNIPQQYSNYLYIGGDRGCSGNCSFCTTKALWSKWRPISNESIIKDVEFKVNTYNKRNVFFTINSADNPNLTIIKLKDMCSRIIDKKIDISFLVPLRAETYKIINDEDIDLLKRAGLYGLFIGAEAGNDFDLKLYNKSCKLDDCYKSIEYYKGHNLYVEVGYITVNPYSTLERIKDNVRWLYENKLAYYQKWIYSYYMPFRGCMLFDKIEKDGLLIDHGLEKDLEYKYKEKTVETFANATSEFINRNRSSNINKTNLFMEIDKLFSKLVNMKYKDDRYIPLSEKVYKMREEIDTVLTEMSEYNYKTCLQVLECASSNGTKEQIATILDRSYNNSDFEKKLYDAKIIIRKLIQEALSFDNKLSSFIK